MKTCKYNAYKYGNFASFEGGPYFSRSKLLKELII